MLDFQNKSHRRYNPLTREWVVVSPHRTQRPWQGQTEKTVRPEAITYDPECYLCPGNTRANGDTNPQYESTFVFDNDYAALQRDAGHDTYELNDLLVAQAETGICRVICFSPRHHLTLSRMGVQEIVKVIDIWKEQYNDLGAKEDINSVQIFENRGAMMGASNPHPHCQVWASSSLPNEIIKEQGAQADYFAKKGTRLLCDYVALEREQRERIVFENDHFLALVPFWAIWPFETMLLPKHPMRSLNDLEKGQRPALAEALKVLTTTYDNLFETSFPYSMGFHQAPTDGEEHPEWQFHAHFYPPLLRSATVRKFMVGFELLGTPQRDITPEAAAQRLREVAGPHYLER